MNKNDRPSGEEKRVNLMRFIDAYQREHNYSPTYREMMAETGMPTLSMVVFHLRKLRERGCVEFSDSTSRTIQLTQAGRERYLASELSET